MPGCKHTSVKCLCCGKEGRPAVLLAATPSEAKSAAARENGKKGGRPRRAIDALGREVKKEEGE